MQPNYQRSSASQYKRPPTSQPRAAGQSRPKRPTSSASKRPTPYSPKQTKMPYFVPEEEAKKPAMVFGLICLLLPPIGIICAWRSRRMTFPLRLILSGIGFASMTLIFFLLMRPDVQVSTIRPTPEVPVSSGYSGIALVGNSQPADVYGAPSEVIPPQPDAVAPSDSYTEPLIQNSGELTDDSIVYAVTNNASSYHMYEICDFQQNNRALTLRNAVNEGLRPCAKCIGTAE